MLIGVDYLNLTCAVVSLLSMLPEALGQPPPCTWVHSLRLRNVTDHATYCEICGAVAPRTRFGIKVEGRHYLCYVKKALSHENDTLVMLDTCPAKGAMLKVSKPSNSVDFAPR